MKNDFSPKAQGITRPDFFHGQVVENNGTFKIEWNDPRSGSCLLNEQELRAREESSRMALTGNLSHADSEEWQYQRNVNYSAEYGLEKLQRHKIAYDKALDTPLRPVIPN